MTLAERIPVAPTQPRGPKCCSLAPTRPANNVAHSGSDAKMIMATADDTCDCPFACKAVPMLHGPMAGIKITPQFNKLAQPPHRLCSSRPSWSVCKASKASHKAESNDMVASWNFASVVGAKLGACLPTLTVCTDHMKAAKMMNRSPDDRFRKELPTA